jgi:hypothetical protein
MGDGRGGVFGCCCCCRRVIYIGIRSFKKEREREKQTYEMAAAHIIYRCGYTHTTHSTVRQQRPQQAFTYQPVSTGAQPNKKAKQIKQQQQQQQEREREREREK